MHKKIHVICGATATGKSKQALELAIKCNGVIINADAIQIYKDIPILSAQPTEAEQQLAPHKLYSYAKANEEYSAALWANMAKKEIELARSKGQLPIIVGGTGLYIKTLMHGIAPMPDVNPEIRQQARTLLAELGNQEFHQLVTKIDANATAKIHQDNTPRLLRIYEVYKQTGKKMSYFYTLPKQIYFPKADFTVDYIDMPRTEIYHNCNIRLSHMAKAGGIAEVEALYQQYGDDLLSLPIAKTIGIKEFLGYITHATNLDTAIETAQKNTRNYAKRQLTWFRNQL